MAASRLCSIVIATLVCSAGLVSAQPRQAPIDPDSLKSSSKVIKAFHDVVAVPSESTVRIRSRGKDVALGVVVASDGLILTKDSELDGDLKVVLKDGKELEATLVGKQDAYDVALLKVEASGLKSIEWKPAKEAKVGQWVASVGTGGDPVAIGVVSVGIRKLKVGDQPPRNLGTNSGYLGVGLEPAEGGAKVSMVQKPSPADKAGLKVGDIVYEVDGRKVIDQESLINVVQRHKPNDEIELKVKRGDDTLVVKPVLGKLPKQMAGNPQETFGNKLSNRRGGFPTILQHDTVLRPADCGGPLVDLDGKCVGINIARAGRTETYAIPSEDVLAMLPDLKSGKSAPTVAVVPPPIRPKKATDPNILLHDDGKLANADLVNPTRKGSRMRSYTIRLTEGEQVAIELDSAEFDAYLRVETLLGAKLAEDDDSGGDTNAKIVFRAPKEEVYRVIVTTFGPNETGAYTLTVRRLADKNADKNADKKTEK